MKKQKCTKTVVTLRKIFTALDGTCAAKRLLVAALKKSDGGKGDRIVFTEKELIETGMYIADHGDAIKGLENVKDLAKLKLSGFGKVFLKTESTDTSRTLYINPAFDFQAIASGFRAFPIRFLDNKTVAKNTSDKTRDISYGLFLCLIERVDELAKTGSVTTTYRNVLENTGWQPKPIVRAKSTLDKGFDKLKAVGIKEGIEILTKPYKHGRTNDYLDKSYVTVSLHGDILTNLLGAFGLKPPIKPDMPFEISTEEVGGEPEQLKLGQNDDLLNSLIRSMTPAELIAVVEAVLGTLKTKIKA